MISVRDLSFRYPDTSGEASSGFALKVPELSIKPGDSAALVGPSGSGKTTLLALIAGILRPASGMVKVGDTRIDKLARVKLGEFRIREIGQVFQSFELLDYLNIVENVLLPMYISGNGNRAEMRERALSLLADVGLGHRSHARPVELSQGEMQRVAVCRAMLNSPGLLLADEPTGNLDHTNKQIVVDLLQRQARQHGSTLLMVTHDESLLGSFDTVLDIRKISTTEEIRT